MKRGNTSWLKKIQWLAAFAMLIACVDPIHIEVSQTQYPLVVDGFITDSPGPYTVKLSTGYDLNGATSDRNPVEKAQIELFDDEGNAESFMETTAGEYKTGGTIQGKVGHAYHIEIKTADGKTFQSAPDTIHSVGQVEAIRYEFEARTIEMNYGPTTADLFNVYLDANGSEDESSYVRWRFIGTYKFVTHPENRIVLASGFPLPDPPVCSGHTIEPGPGGGILTQQAPCTCCECWISQFENIPHLSDGQFIRNHEFKNIKIAEVPVNGNTFQDRYMIEVQQMSLTKSSYEYFDLIKKQKEGATSLFQPPFAEIRGNLVPTNSSDPVVGLFWATSIKSKFTFIERDDVPYILPPPDYVTEPCTALQNSSNVKPAQWP